MKSWQLQNAKNKFSEVVDSAIKDGPQIVTRHGSSVVVVISYAEYLKLKAKTQPLSQFFGSALLDGVFLERDKSPLRDSGELPS